MSDRIEREELVRLAAQRTMQDVEMVGKVVDAFLDEIYQAMKRGQGVTLKGLDESG
jgi:nucleoid DNA-binding protein